MCTALSICMGTHYFGRNLDLDRSYGEEVCVMPRRFPLHFRTRGDMSHHYAMIGMATVMEGIPLFYDAANEYGLSIAGLRFPGNAWYAPMAEGKDNITPFELIPWILGQCRTTADAKNLLSHMNLVDIPFSPQLPLAPLHWIISDREQSIVLEPMRDGLHIHENPVGVLTNNPPFAQQLENLAAYSHLRTDYIAVPCEENLPYVTDSLGLGAVGLPGDVSSMSRFVRMAFGSANSVCDETESAAVGQFFHLLDAVAMIKGVCRTDEGALEYTKYSACMNTQQGLYYYTTYGNRRICCVDMHKTDLEGSSVSRFPLLTNESICYQN